MEIREYFEWIRARLKDYLETERAIALKLKISPQKLNMKYNHAKSNWLEISLAMSDLSFEVEGKDNGYGGKPLAEGICDELKARLTKLDVPAKPASPCSLLRVEVPCCDYVDAQNTENILNKIKKESNSLEKGFIDRVLETAEAVKGWLHYDCLQVAKVFMNELYQNRGRPVYLSENEEKIRQVFAKHKGRLDDFVPKALGLGGRDKYRAAEKIEEEAREELIQAIHTKQLTVFTAEQLLASSSLEVTRALREGKKSVRALIAKNQAKAGHQRLPVLMATVLQNAELEQGEQACNLPLRIVWMGVLSCCDKTGYFPWEPAQLKATVANVSLDLSMEASLKVLCDWGWIEKWRIGDAFHGRVLALAPFLSARR